MYLLATETSDRQLSPMSESNTVHVYEVEYKHSADLPSDFPTPDLGFGNFGRRPPDVVAQ